MRRTEVDRAGRTPTEERIRAAALVCIGRFGLAKTTLDDVAREAGVSRATIYRAFPGGRDTLLYAVLQGEVHRFFADLAVELDRQEELEGLLVAGLGAAMRLLHDHAALRALVTLEPHLLLPQVAFHRLDPLLREVTAFAAPYLRPHVGAVAEELAEQVIRIVLSYTLQPSDRLDPHDEASVRRLVRHHILPGLPCPTPSRPTTPEGTR